ncbi:MAG: hypothetical protein K1X74_14870 [Pirellulales bacterium]|nr:hypothetical protein [Pirellulales bacterium]
MLRSTDRSARRGAAMIIVMVLLAMTMVVTYSVLHTSATVTQIQANGGREDRAHLAAAAGISAALRAMHNASVWTGVSTTLTGSLSTLDSYSVTYTAGDSSLTVSSSDYAEYPYRVTLLSTGTAVDSSNPALSSTHQIRVVVQLVREQLSAQPSNWSSLSNYTVYQNKDSRVVKIDFPCRITGNVLFNGDLDLCRDYPDGSSRATFTIDMGNMPGAGQADYRPFGGTVTLNADKQLNDDSAVLSAQMQTAVNTISGAAASLGSSMSSVTTYRLYAGGPVYSIPALASSISNVTLAPDVPTNPLGIFRATSNITVGSNVTIQGMLRSPAKITISGSNVVVSGANLGPLRGSSTPVHLPTLRSNDLTVNAWANCTVTGLVWVDNAFKSAKGASNGSLTITGRVLCEEFLVEGRNEWDLGLSYWNLMLSVFNTQKGQPGGIQYYPAYCVTLPSLSLTPLCTIQPPTSNVTYHGSSLSNPVFAPATGAAGLKWDLVSWADVN